MNKYLEIFNVWKETSTKNYDLLLEELRNSGASQMESTLCLVLNLKIAINEADEIVLNSLIWQDSKEQNLSLRDGMNELFTKLT